MRFNRKNPKFLIDFATLILAIAVIAMTVAVLISGSDTLLGLVFYVGAGMFVTNIVRGIVSKRYLSILFIIPVILCVTGGLVAQGVIRPWIF
ncbi:MAG: hypothetical protein K6G42_07515 [Lachnospiraceae bacterium]|nr:hypothetical protein [Lachnospiraceae bacterium]